MGLPSSSYMEKVQQAESVKLVKKQTVSNQTLENGFLIMSNWLRIWNLKRDKMFTNEWIKEFTELIIKYYYIKCRFHPKYKPKSVTYVNDNDSSKINLISNHEIMVVALVDFVIDTSEEGLKKSSKENETRYFEYSLKPPKKEDSNPTEFISFGFVPIKYDTTTNEWHPTVHLMLYYWITYLTNNGFAIDFNQKSFPNAGKTRVASNCKNVKYNKPTKETKNLTISYNDIIGFNVIYKTKQIGLYINRQFYGIIFENIPDYLFPAVCSQNDGYIVELDFPEVNFHVPKN